MTENIPEQFSREMGITHKEFMRTLATAVQTLEYRTSEKEISISHPLGMINILLHETGSRNIASISLPVTRVDFKFKGLDVKARSDFMAHFDLCFHRGGG